VGRTAVDKRLFVRAVLWVLRSGMRWQDMPERFGRYKSVHKRFPRWAQNGVWDRMFADLLKDRENRYAMIDSGIVWAHQQAASARQKRASETVLEWSRGDFDDHNLPGGQRTRPAARLCADRLRD
jgi:transposase